MSAAHIQRESPTSSATGSRRPLGPLLLAVALCGCRGPVPASHPPLVPAARAGDLPLDGKDRQPVILGLADRGALVAHRDIYRTATAKAVIPPEWRARWKRIDAPCVLSVAFGSWCGDTQRELPDLLALLEEPNPFISVKLVGVYRDKVADEVLWPEGVVPEKVARVPTFWLYAMKPGGGYHLVGSIVENPPRKGQRMAEALLELLERMK